MQWQRKNPSLWRKLNISSVGPNHSHYTHWAIVAAHASSDTIFGNSVKVSRGVYNCTYIIQNRHFVTTPNLTYTNRCIHKARLKAVICLNASLHVNLQFTMSLSWFNTVAFGLPFGVVTSVRNSLTLHCNKSIPPAQCDGIHRSKLEPCRERFYCMEVK
jgi:hypothetical protein